jgi:very-short-patch-repair endonuclease
MKDRARKLRKRQTDAEKIVWHEIRDRTIADSKFRRQHVIGPYIVDFVCMGHGLIVELDGGQHAEQRVYDANRTSFLESKGYHVVRFWNNDVLQDRESVLREIHRLLELRKGLPSPRPSPKGRGS